MSVPIDRFHLDLSTYLGAAPEVAADATCQELSRLIAIRDGGAPAEAIGRAEGLTVACLALLESVVGPEDVADALAREAARYRRKAALAASIMQAYEGRIG